MNKQTQDQIASVMLQFGTPKQQKEALLYCGIEKNETEFASTIFDSDPLIVEFKTKLDKTFSEVKAYLESGDDNAPWNLQRN